MTLNQFIEELQFYAGKTMGCGNFQVKAFEKVDSERQVCKFRSAVITIDFDDEEIHLWPNEGEA